ncbi:MAG: LysR family transcriptional regulator [Actinomycetota bacterium]
MALDRTHLELLGALTEHPTLRAAAQSINLSPSAASRRLDDAERRVGVALTETIGRTLTLTAAGRYLADAARDADRRLADAELAARWLDRGETRPVRIGLGFHDAIPWALSTGQPIEIVRTTESGWPAALAAGTIDLVVDVGDAPATGPRLELATDRLVAVVPAGHPLATNGHGIDGPDLAPLPYFASAVEPRPGFEFEQLFRPSGSSPRNIVRVESAAITHDLVAAGRGVTVQPALAVPPRTDLAIVGLARSIEVRWWAYTTGSTEAADIATSLANALTARRNDRSRHDGPTAPLAGRRFSPRR